MYAIYADFDSTGVWENLYYQGDPDFVAYDVECELALGDSGSVKLSVPKSNPGYARLKTRKTLLDFRIDNRSLGVFEVREVSRDIYGTAEVYAVGELSWLYDSVQPQAEYHDLTARQFIAKLLEQHNAQCPDHRFTVGIVDVTDSNDSLYRYTNREQTLDAIRDKLVDRLGGNLRVRRDGTTRYLDYVSDQTYGSESEQTIRFGENLLDYSDNFTVDDLCTELVPLGARLENDKGDNSNIGNLEKRLTVESVNGGRDYISNSKLVQRFGHIRTPRTWDDVNIPSNLLAKARAWLETEQYERMRISVRAVDLSMTDAQFGALRLGDRAYVVCDPFGLKASYVIRKRTYHPDDPSQDSIDLGDTVRRDSFVSSQVRATSETVRKADEHERLQAEWLTDAIQNVSAMMTGSRGGYKLTEYDEDGRWLADYIMDSMDKQTAKVVKKVTVDGTAYSCSGVNGPYDVAIMANGTILGKYIQAHSISAEQISQSYTSKWEDADAKTLNTARTEFKAADAKITASVTANKKDADGKITSLSSRVTLTESGLSTKVTKGQINSAIEQSAEKIYIRSNKFGWKSTNSELSTDGILNAQKAVLRNATITGKTITGAEGGWRMELNNSQLAGFNGSNQKVGYISPGASVRYLPTGQVFPSLQVQSNGYVRISSPHLSVSTSSDTNVTSTDTWTGTITGLCYRGGEENYWYQDAHFIHGMLVTPF